MSGPGPIRVNHEVFPFTWTGCDPVGDAEGSVRYYGVVWRAEWGPFAGGHEVECLAIDYSTGILTVYVDGVGSKVPFVALPGRSEDYWPKDEEERT